MERNLFRFVWRNSRAQQLYLLALVLVSWPFNYMLYDVPKNIVNRAIGQTEPPYPFDLFGVTVSRDLGQLPLLFVLCVMFLVLVVGNNGIKYHLGVYQGRLAERLLRRMRYELYGRVLRFPLPQFRRVSQGEIVAMITGQAEQVGNFTSAAFVDPVSLGGQLLVTSGFILVQNPLMGMAALAFYPVQMWLIPRLQKKVSALAKQRQREVRKLSENIGEAMSGIVEIRANDVERLERSRFSERQGRIFDIRYEIFRRKFAIKFTNNFIDKLAPFFFYLFGGWLVITGDLTLGALMAVIAAHKDMGGPWKELLTWYQDQRTASEIYDDVVEQFDPPGVLPEATPTDGPVPALRGALALANVSLADEDGAPRLAGVTLEIPLDRHMAVIGPPGGGKDELMLVLARLTEPGGGKMMLDGKDVAALPQAATGRRIGYVGQSAYLQSGAVKDALLYALKHRPQRAGDLTAEEARRRRADLAEARRSGNSDDDYRADWVDYQEAGAADRGELSARLVEALRATDMVDDIYQMGLRGMIDPTTRPELAANVMLARAALADRLKEPAYAALVEPFDRAKFNTNATVAENLLFGTPVGDKFETDNLAGNAYVLSILRAADLYDELLATGRQLAATMVEIFADLPPGHEFFQQFPFIDSDDLPEVQAILARVERSGLDKLGAEDTKRLLGLPFKLIPARHRLGLVEADMQAKLLAARRLFAERLAPEDKGAVEFFDRNRYNRAASLQDNILFGKLVYGQASGAQKLGDLIGATLDDLKVRDSVIEAGLDFEVGVGGGRLSAAQRQKLALARALLRRSDLLLVHEATAALDPATEERVLAGVLAARKGRGVVWALTRQTLADRFDEVVVVEHGRAHKEAVPQAAQ